MTSSSTMISRQKLLEAAMRVFAESGFRGATTRRIAEAAGVNEVTLFRQFKSKSALINEAAELYARQRSEHDLPAEPVAPLDELAEWCSTHLVLLRNSRGLIRKCMAEMEEHPLMAGCMRHGPDVVHSQLLTYATRLAHQRDLSLAASEIAVACMMLQGSLFSDAMGRDIMPDLFPRPPRQAGRLYARTFLRAMGLDPASEPSNGDAARRGNRTNGSHAAGRARQGTGPSRPRPAR
jgi:AcrR family transcriptional regulator